MVVHGVLSLNVGGLERIVASLATHVLCVETPGPLAAGMTVRCLNKPAGRPNLFEPAKAALRELNATVLHTHQIGAAYHLAPAAKALGLRVVHTEHGNPFARATTWSETLRLRMLMRQAAKSIDAFACVTDEIAAAVSCYRTVSAGKVCVVPNGVAKPIANRSRDEVRDSLSIPRDAFVLGSVGRLHEVKRQHLLIDAIHDEWLLIVGDGPERTALEALARGKNVVFAGYQSNPADFLNAMDVFALSSRSEGFPVSLLEAWAMNVPVLAAAVGGMKTIIHHGENGWLVKDHSDPAAYAAAMRAMKPRLNDLAAAGHVAWAKRYTLDAMRNAYERLYLRP